ncbi:MAG: hypothetical protein ACYDHN_15040 [Solirubrobacteraceae bacterium]
MWDHEDLGMMKIAVPEAKVNDTYRAAIMEILSSRFNSPDGWVQGSNKLQYQALWLRDGALETYALDLVGLARQASENLSFMKTYQQPDGLLISRPGQYDGLGQALWALDEHAQLTQSPIYAREQLATMSAAIAWLEAATARDPLGLLPPSDPGDDELVDGHITGDDLWAAMGLQAAISDATLAGRSDLAAAWQRTSARFDGSLTRAIALAVARVGHIPPALDVAGGQDWGNYSAAYPVEVLTASSPAVQATVAWAEDHMAQGLATYLNGASLHDYLGFSIFETDLAAGRVAATVRGLYDELDHTTSTDSGWEWDVSPDGPRSTKSDMSPHGTFAADYVALLRNMLVRERGVSIELLRGASPAWLKPGQQIRVTGAQTSRGVISFSERSSQRGETLVWHSSLKRGTKLVWAVPQWTRRLRSAGAMAAGKFLALNAPSGELRVSFSGQRPDESYLASVRELNAWYLRRHRSAPIVAAAK